MVIGLIGTWKFLRIALIIMSAGAVVFSIFSAIITGASGGGWDDLARSTGGRLISADRDIGLTVEKLKDVQLNPQNYDSIDVDNMKSRIFFNIGIFIIVGFLIFKFFVWFWSKAISTGEANVGFGAYAIIIVFTLLILSFLQMGWLVYESKFIDDAGYFDRIHAPEAIPFYGIYNFVRNIDIMKISGGKDLPLGLEKEVVNTTENIIENINPDILNIVDR